MLSTEETQEKKIYRCASYARLSQDDGEPDAVSGSVLNQQLLIKTFIDSHDDMVLVEEYADDGFSGVNFERPAFQRMMKDIRASHCDCLVVKDLSRLGRNYIEVGRYMEQVFPILGIRFIAINDSVDTARKQSSAEQFVLPFKNLFNDAYLRDLSDKVRSQLAVKRKNGDFVGSFSSYGYQKDPGNRNHLIIDPTAAEIVRLIFSWKIQGMSAARIAEELNGQGILCPMEYKNHNGEKYSSPFRTKDRAKWSAVTVLRILKNDLYTGVMTQGRVMRPSYKIRQKVEKPESQWDRVEDTHEAIIPRDVYDAVQTLLLRDTRTAPSEDRLHLFAGYLVCADCKQGMSRRKVRRGEKAFYYFYCTGSRNHTCTSHNFSEKLLYDTVLAALQQQYLLVMDMARLIKYAQDLPDDPKSLHRFEVQLAQLEYEVRHNQDMKVRLIENLNEGILTREDYVDLSEIYDRRIREARMAMRKVEAERDGIKELPVEGEWLAAFRKHQNIQYIDRVLLAELVDVIEIHEGKHITIHFKFEDQVKRVCAYLAGKGLTPQPRPLGEEGLPYGTEEQEGNPAPSIESEAGSTGNDGSDTDATNGAGADRTR